MISSCGFLRFVRTFTWLVKSTDGKKSTRSLYQSSPIAQIYLDKFTEAVFAGVDFRKYPDVAVFSLVFMGDSTRRQR